MSCRFLVASKKFLATSSRQVTKRVLPQPSCENRFANVFVLTMSHLMCGTIPNRRSFTFALSATRNPISFTFLGKSVLKSLGLGPKATPPPRNIGLPLSPNRARPEPFCGRIFFPEYATSARVLVDAVPRRNPSRYHTTHAC